MELEEAFKKHIEYHVEYLKENMIFPEVSEDCADDRRNNYFNEIDYYYSEVKFHLDLFKTSIKQFNLKMAKHELEDDLIPNCIELEIILRALRDKLENG
jgi:hypothetical protein